MGGYNGGQEDWGSVSPFRELDVRASIKQQFSNLVILEYPVIYVSLPAHSSDFDVVKDTNPVTEKPELKDSESNPSPIGAPFKEEEIEDNNNSSDPRVFELIKHVSSSPMPRSPHYNLRTEKEIDNSSECPLFSRVATSNWSHSTSNSNEAGVSQMMDFDFDQGLIDSYSELIAQINPDDFLDLEFEFAEELDAEGRRER
ncbi:uncharacterized protein LOC122274678 [Carya illinoinensis]|uniref:uncharacterized protein LOC122274678 n=1 Tax=Carya illinoinensis TaxID=32201 RepID=UPI001C7202C8|nr:uncharacterized protein LOC122274678 [Carya illinoinensis]